MDRNTKRVLCAGTFDHLHPGHIDFLKQAKALGDELIVIVARDENVQKIKGVKPIERGKMGKVKSALEIALEKAGKIGELSQEEKEKMKDEEKVMSILKEFYQGKLDSNGLWQRLKGNKSSLLTMAQINLIDSISLGSSQEDIQTRKKGILAIETLKEKQNTAMVESGLHVIEELQKEFEEMKEQVVEDLKRQMEMNPQLRMQPVKTPDGRTVMQMTLSVDEAVKARLADYFSEHEKQYNQEFTRVIEALKGEVK